MSYKIKFTDFSNRPYSEVTIVGTFDTEALAEEELARLKNKIIARNAGISFTPLQVGNGFSFGQDNVGYLLGSYEIIQ